MKELQFPLIKICLFFVLGIILYPYINVTFIEIISIFTLVLLLFAFIVFKKIFLEFGSVFILFLAVLLGLSTTSIHDVKQHKNHYLHLNAIQNKNEIIVALGEKLKSTVKNVRYEATVLKIKGVETEGKIIVSIKKNQSLPNFEYGTKVRFTSKIQLLTTARNPNQFDYKKYLENKSIFGQIYVSSNEISYAPPSKFSFRTIASRIRNTILENLEKNHFKKEELHVFAALLLGQQQDISKEIMQDYQYAGAIHVLSVSGLHVGLLLGFITILLSPLPNTRKNAIIKLVIILISLSFFGILAGLSPSVLRSVTMFSFVAIGMFFRRSVNFYNTLFISAFLLLLLNPSFLYDVGFQLSYLALFFIVWAQPLLASLYKPKNKITTSIWDIITVSTAAQIGTLPISIYYFHQFSGLFFVTNCIILPLLSIIMGIGIVVLLMAAANCFWLPIVKLMELSIWFINSIIHKIASFEQFVMKDIPFTNWMMMGLYLVICTFILFLKKPDFRKIMIAFCSIILFQISMIDNKFQTEKSEEFIVFSKNKSSLFAERKGQEITIISNENEKNNVALKNYVVAHSSKIVSRKKLQNMYYFHSKKIVVIDSSCVFLPKSKPEIFVLIQSPKVNLETIIHSYKPKQIVADASNYKSYVALWKATCLKENIPFHAVAEKGYYKID